MTKNQQSPVHVVVGYDFSDTSHLALERAIGHAEAMPHHMLHILTVLDGNFEVRPHRTKKLNYEQAAEVQTQLTEALESRLRNRELQNEIHFFVHARIGDPKEELLRLAEETGAHLIVVGSHGRTGIQRVLMGSVSEKVVREAKCPVLVVREREYEDVEFATIVTAPEGHAEDSPYIKPHRYSYFNALIKRQESSWPWY